MKEDGRHGAGGMALIDGQQVGAGDRTDGGDAIGEEAGQFVGHAAAVGEAVGVDAGRVEVVFGRKVVDQVRDEGDIDRLAVGIVCKALQAPAQGYLGAGGVDDDEAVAVGQLVPAADLCLVGGPLGEAVQADDQGRGAGGIVAIGDVEQVAAGLTGGEQGAVGLVDQAGRRPAGAARGLEGG